MPGLTLMVQGTGSHVGKSVLVAALCRIFRQDGLSVAPFKAQNMANNAHVCAGGGEIGRSQAVQAMASGLEPTVDMNPVLLKPCSDSGSQVVVKGRAVRTMKWPEYQVFRRSLFPVVRESLDRLRAAHEVVVIEGAGSPAEINLREGDLANMGVAEMADAPVLLVGNIDWGGVFAQLVGTLHLLAPDERARVRAFVINKFRGDLAILQPGLDFLERETGRPVLGVLPWWMDLRIAEEDTVPEARPAPAGAPGAEKIRIDVILNPRIANFTDLDPLEAEPDVELRWLRRPDQRLPHALILPGTKSTIADLRELRAAGLDRHVFACVERGCTVVGLCGGLQMLGERIADPHHVESDIGEEAGLGLLPLVTVFGESKETTQVRGIHIESGAPIRGYEIHMGRTEGPSSPEPLFRITERGGRPADGLDGVSARGGQVWGTYIHGIFDSDAFRRHFLARLGGVSRAAWRPEAELDRLTARVRERLDMDLLYRILRREA